MSLLRNVIVLRKEHEKKILFKLKSEKSLTGTEQGASSDLTFFSQPL